MPNEYSGIYVMKGVHAKTEVVSLSNNACYCIESKRAVSVRIKHPSSTEPHPEGEVQHIFSSYEPNCTCKGPWNEDVTAVTCRHDAHLG